jgi:hypothetical protein
MEHQNEMPANPARVYTQTAGRAPPTIPVSYTYHWPVGRQRPAHESRSHIGVAQVIAAPKPSTQRAWFFAFGVLGLPDEIHRKQIAGMEENLETIIWQGFICLWLFAQIRETGASVKKSSYFILQKK